MNLLLMHVYYVYVLLDWEKYNHFTSSENKSYTSSVFN